jgi:D-xylonolactonase
MTTNLEMLADYACVVGENPLWHPQERRIYWTDIASGRLFRYDVATKTHEQFYTGDPVGGFTFQEDGSLLLFMDKGAIRHWKDGTLTTIRESISDELESRFNDVFADPKGRVYCGTMPTPSRPGRLYRLDTDGSLHIMVEGITCSNGMGLTPDHKQLYYTDSMAYRIYRFDYDIETGDLSNQTIFASNPESEGLPDGMTVDAEGYVWSARWDGNRLVRYAPDGTLVQTIEFPVRKVSSVVFGGDDYTDMYVTTAGGDEKETDGAQAGALFCLNIGVQGVAEFPSRLKIG